MGSISEDILMTGIYFGQVLILSWNERRTMFRSDERLWL